MFQFCNLRRGVRFSHRASINNMINEVEQYNKDKKVFTKKLKTYIQDKSIPLDDRWVVFTTAELGKRKPFIVDYKSINDLVLDPAVIKRGDSAWNDHWDIDRHSTVVLKEIVDEWILESTTWKDTPEQLEALIKIKEEVLDKFIWSFRVDW